MQLPLPFYSQNPNRKQLSFEIYPEVRLVVLVHLYGTPGKVDEIRAICKKHNALLIEDAAEGGLLFGFGRLDNDSIC